MSQKPSVLKEIEAKRKAERQEAAILALRNVLSTPDGKTAIWYLVNMTQFFAPKLMVPSSEIYANAGNRDLGYDILVLMSHANEKALLELQSAEWHRAVEERIEDEKLLKESS